MDGDRAKGLGVSRLGAKGEGVGAEGLTQRRTLQMWRRCTLPETLEVERRRLEEHVPLSLSLYYGGS